MQARSGVSGAGYGGGVCQLSNMPTCRFVGLSVCWEVGDLASWHYTAASAGVRQGEMASAAGMQGAAVVQGGFSRARLGCAVLPCLALVVVCANFSTCRLADLLERGERRGAGRLAALRRVVLCWWCWVWWGEIRRRVPGRVGLPAGAWGKVWSRRGGAGRRRGATGYR